jgi:hypothetical protein
MDPKVRVFPNHAAAKPQAQSIPSAYVRHRPRSWPDPFDHPHDLRRENPGEEERDKARRDSPKVRDARDVGSFARPCLSHVFPGLLQVADDCFSLCFCEDFVEAAHGPAGTFDCRLAALLVELTGHPHRLVSLHGISATANPKHNQHHKDTMGCLQEHRRDTATLSTKAPRTIVGSLTEALSSLACIAHLNTDTRSLDRPG